MRRADAMDNLTDDAVPVAIARGYAAADPPLRARVIACLTRPLNLLGLFAVAAGAFARAAVLGAGGERILAMDDGARFTTEQIVELARFVEQVSPQALHQCLVLLALVR